MKEYFVVVNINDSHPVFVAETEKDAKDYFDKYVKENPDIQTKIYTLSEVPFYYRRGSLI